MDLSYKNLIEVSNELKKIYESTDNIIKNNTKIFLGVRNSHNYLTSKEFFAFQEIILNQLNRFIEVKLKNKLILAEFNNEVKNSILLKSHLLTKINNTSIDLVDI